MAHSSAVCSRVEALRQRAKRATVLAVMGIALLPFAFFITAFGAGLAAAGR